MSNPTLNPEPLPIATLQDYLNSLTTLFQTISVARHHHLPNLIHNLQVPIQHDIQKIQSIPTDHLAQTWKTDSQNLIEDVKSIRTQVVHSQQIMKYVRSSSKVDATIDSEQRALAQSITSQIIQKVTRERLSSKSRSSLSRSSKSGVSIDKKVIQDQIIRWKIEKKLKNQLASSLTCFSLPLNSNFLKDETSINLNKIITSINQFNKEDIISLVSNNHILLKHTMRVFLIFKPHSTNSIVERVFCYGLNESPKMIYQRSSFTLIRSINRCINHTISQYSTSSIEKDKLAQNQSNLILICSLVSSYKDLFTSELTNWRVKTASATSGGKGRMYIKRSRDPRLINNDDYNQSTSNIIFNRNNSTNVTSNMKGNVQDEQQKKQASLQRGHNTIGGERFLTWRRWSLEKRYLDQLVDEKLKKENQQKDDGMEIDVLSPLNHDSKDVIHQILSQGKWIKIPEIH